jgi:hypothetical protein
MPAIARSYLLESFNSIRAKIPVSSPLTRDACNDLIGRACEHLLVRHHNSGQISRLQVDRLLSQACRSTVDCADNQRKHALADPSSASVLWRSVRSPIENMAQRPLSPSRARIRRHSVDQPHRTATIGEDVLKTPIIAIVKRIPLLPGAFARSPGMRVFISGGMFVSSFSASFCLLREARITSDVDLTVTVDRIKPGMSCGSLGLHGHPRIARRHSFFATVFTPHAGSFQHAYPRHRSSLGVDRVAGPEVGRHNARLGRCKKPTNSDPVSKRFTADDTALRLGCRFTAVGDRLRTPAKSLML